MSRARSSVARAMAMGIFTLTATHGVVVMNADGGSREAFALVQQGLAKAEAGEHDNAIALFSRAITEDPRYADAYALRGVEWTELGDCTKAIADYDRAIRMHPRHFPAYANRSRCWGRLGELRKAFADLAVAERLNPAHPMLVYNRGDLLFKSQDFDGAVRAYERSIELMPDYAPAHADLGSALTKRSAFRQALQHFDKSIALDATYVDAWRNRALTKREIGDIAGAVEDLTEAIRLEPQRAEFWFIRGKMQYDLARYDAALEDLGHHCELEPGDQDYSRLYMWLARAATGEREAGNTGLAAYLQERLSRHTGKTTDTWVPQLAAFLLGKVDADALRTAAAAASDRAVRSGRICEANFYIGAVQLLSAEHAAAAGAFRQCMKTGLSEYVEFQSARVMLRRLEAEAAIKAEQTGGHVATGSEP